MKKTIGINPTYRADETGGLISVCWHCPYCGGHNGGAYFTLKAEVLQDDFVMDHDWEFCGKKVSVVCVDAEWNLELLNQSLFVRKRVEIFHKIVNVFVKPRIVIAIKALLG